MRMIIKYILYDTEIYAILIFLLPVVIYHE